MGKNDGELKNAIQQCGFEYQGKCDARQLRIRPEVRDMCSSNKCHSYQKSWSCPPGCGSLKSFEAMIQQKKICYLAQTVMSLEDKFDVETMLEAARINRQRLDKLHAILNNCGAQAFILGSGTCEICEVCTYPTHPCRFPERKLVSMEAAGLIVSEVCQCAGIPYNHGDNTICYTGCVLI